MAAIQRSATVNGIEHQNAVSDRADAPDSGTHFEKIFMLTFLELCPAKIKAH